MTWAHDALMNDLASYLRAPDRMVWTDMQLGPSGSPRPDVYTLQKSYSKPMPTAFEVKVSRSDLRSDTTSGKWQSYLKFAGSVTFAVPDGLCTVVDIPDGCGLIVRKDQVWRYARRPTIQRVTLPMDACMKLLIDGAGRCFHGVAPKSRTIDSWKENDKVRERFGQAVALAARDLTAAQSRVANLKSTAEYEEQRMRKDVEARKALLLEQARTQVAEYERTKHEICDWLGLAPDTSAFAVRRKITELKLACDCDARVRAAELKITHAHTTLANVVLSLAPPKSEAAA